MYELSLDRAADLLAADLFADLPEVLAHSRRVAARLGAEEGRAVALLHDALEDTTATAADLAPVVGARVVRAVEELTRSEAEPYAEYVERVAASGDRLALAVKLADLADHFALADTLRPSLRRRYERARDVLTRAAARTYDAS